MNSNLRDIFNNYYHNKSLKFDEIKNLSDNDELNKDGYLKIWDPSQGFLSKYITVENFNSLLIELEKLSKNKTDLNFHAIYSGASNLVYIDIDFELDRKFAGERCDKINKEIGKEFSNILSKNYNKSKYYIFIAEIDSTRHNGGIHIFLFNNKDFYDPEDRNDWIETFYEHIDNSQLRTIMFKSGLTFYEGSQVLEDPRDLIDLSRLHSADSVIFPYAQKWIKDKTDLSNHRYICKHSIGTDDVSLVKNGIAAINAISTDKIDPSYIIKNADMCMPNLATLKTLNSKDRKNKFLALIYKWAQVKEQDINGFEISKYPGIMHIADILKFLYDFCDGVSFLCDEHPVLVEFRHAGEYTREENETVKEYSKRATNAWRTITFRKNFLTLFITLVIMKHGEIPKYIDKGGILPEIFYSLLSPIYARADAKTDDGDLWNMNAEIITKCTNPDAKWISKSAWFFNSVNSSIMKHFKEFLLVLDEQKKSNNKRDKKSSKKQSNENEENNIESLRLDYNIVVHDHFKIILRKWFKYINTQIFNKLTNEILPFNETDRTRNIMKYGFEELNSNKKNRKYYYLHIRNLNKMFITALAWNVGLDSTGFSCASLFIEIIKKYIRNFLHFEINEKEITKYVYNIKQTKALESIPHNQFVIDKGNFIQDWITNMFEYHVKPFYIEESKDNAQGGVFVLLDLLINKYGIPARLSGYDARVNKFMKAPENYNKLIKQIIKDLTSLVSADDKHNYTKVNPHDDKYFGVRNGILEYYKNNGKWDIRLYNNTQNIFLGQYSLVKFNYEDFKRVINGTEDSIVYKNLIETLEHTYPLKDELNFMLDIFSSTICPLIVKDRFLFTYGTGSDGKSTIDNILSNILGRSTNDNTATSVTCTENGKQYVLNNPCGYASTFQASSLSKSDKAANQHDEGGIIMLRNKTFSVAPELGQGIITSSILKQITGGGEISGRAIFKAATMFTPNCLVVVETNNLPKFDIIDDAVKRRVIVYSHRAKFTTATNSSKYKNMEFHYEADAGRIDMITKTSEYWSMLFYILLKHALKLLNENNSSNSINSGKCLLSNIEVPYRVQVSTQSAFSKNSGLTGWLNTNILNSSEVNGAYIMLYDLVNKIRTINSTLKNQKKAGIINVRYGATSDEINEYIYKKLGEQYAGSIYSLNDWKQRPKDLDDILPEDIRKKYTSGYALPSIDDSITEAHNMDLILLGWMYDYDNVECDYENNDD